MKDDFELSTEHRAAVEIGETMESIKVKVADYWAQRVSQFSALRIKELNREKAGLWMHELETYLPEWSGLNILDIGTGTGFFAFLLAARGHTVTGVDLTADMIREAKHTAKLLSLPADFFVMDAEDPRFSPHSFDAIVTRNLTWTLPHLEKAYKRWHTLLKPGGVLVNFDADYCREVQAPLPANHAHRQISAGLMQEYESIKDVLRPMQCARPQWDVALLNAAGFGEITVDTDVWKRIYGKEDEFYNPTPIFTISAKA